MVWYIVLGIIALLLILLFFAVKPYTKRFEEMERLFGGFAAHRGLFDNETERPENSLNAFRYAVQNNFGIELDVQLTKDGKVIVLHDTNLLRYTGQDIPVAELTYDELQKYHLFNSNQTVPLFEDVLKILDGKVTMICEIKADGPYLPICEAAAKYLDQYKGIYCIESFNPLAVKWFKKNRKHVLRGQLSTNYTKDNIPKPWILRGILTNCFLNFLAKPDFIAYNWKYCHSLAFAIQRGLGGYMAAWTVKDQETEDDVKEYFDTLIFDSYVPQVKKK